MPLQDQSGVTSITMEDAERLTDEQLRRWLTWALKGDPAEARIRRDSMGSRQQLLNALTWIGAIS